MGTSGRGGGAGGGGKTLLGRGGWRADGGPQLRRRLRVGGCGPSGLRGLSASPRRSPRSCGGGGVRLGEGRGESGKRAWGAAAALAEPPRPERSGRRWALPRLSGWRGSPQEGRRRPRDSGVGRTERLRTVGSPEGARRAPGKALPWGGAHPASPPSSDESVQPLWSFSSFFPTAGGGRSVLWLLRAQPAAWEDGGRRETRL